MSNFFENLVIQGGGSIRLSKNNIIKVEKLASLIAQNDYNAISREKVKFSIKKLNEEKIIEVENDCVSFNKNFCKKNFNIFKNFGYTKYQIMSFFEFELKSVYFKNEILGQFLNNSLYDFRWQSYRGYLVSKENSEDNIYIKNLCLAHDLISNEPIVSIFLYELINQDKAFQNFIERYELVDNVNLEVAGQNIKNLIEGERYRYEDIDIYNLILIGLKIVNYQTQALYEKDLFLNTKSIDEYEYFHPLFISSRTNYYLFALEFCKIMFESINKKLVKQILLEQKIYITKDDMKCISISNLCKQMTEERFHETIETFIKDLTDLRNIPAHELYNNEFDPKYWKLQDEILVFGYQFVYAYIISFTKGKLPSNYSKFENIFGSQGRIGYGNGFNRSPYYYFDGQICAVCEQLGEKDAEFLIAFKKNENQIESLIKLITRKRPDLDSENIQYVVNKIFQDELLVATDYNLKSFFKGYIYANKGIYDQKKYIKKGIEYYNKFKSRYSLDNIYLFADTTDPYFSDFNECKFEKRLSGQGYITELLRYFRNNYEYDTLMTDPLKNNQIQILSNIWD